MSLLSAAVAYAKMGIKIFPLAPRSKKPLEGGHGLLDATCDVEQVTKWWTDHPDYNIGCNCGESGLAVLDADLYKPMAEEHLEDLLQQIGRLPDTWTAITGGGGYQYFFETSERLRSGADCLGDGLDFKADGGYVVLPPSIHPSGKKYEWELSSTPMNCPLAPCPLALAELRGKRKSEPKETASIPVDSEHLQSALEAIPAENYSQWVEVGMAIKAALGEPGFGLWDVWSTGSTKYNAEEMREKWDSFRGCGITPGTLFHYALENGWEPPQYTLDDFRKDTKGWVGEAARRASEGFPVILAADIKPRQLEWLIDGAIAINTCGFMTGHPGTFKSWACAEMMVAVASGSKAFGTRKTRQGTVLGFNAEDDPAIITRTRLDRLTKGRHLELQSLPIYLLDVDNLRLDKPEDIARLRITVKELQAALLVLDPLRNLHWVDEDSSTAMTPILAGIRSIQQQTGCSILLVHHDRKGNNGDERRESRTRGSNSLEGWRDFALYCDTPCKGVVSITPYIKGCAAPAPWTYSILDEPNGSASAITTTPEEHEGDTVVELLRRHPEGLTRNTIQKLMQESGKGVRRDRVLATISHLIEHHPHVYETTTTITKGNGRTQQTTVVKLSDWGLGPAGLSAGHGSAGPPIRGGTSMNNLVPELPGMQEPATRVASSEISTEPAEPPYIKDKGDSDAN